MLSSKKIEPKDQKLLDELRSQLGITIDTHKDILRELGTSLEQFESLASESANECVVCMGEKAEYILLPCGHLCLCGDCKSGFRPHGSGGSGLTACPKCRASIDKIQKVY